MIAPMLAVSLAAIILGLMLKFSYKRGFFDNSVYLPILIIGIILLICTLYGAYKLKHSANLFDLTIDQIEKIEFTDSFDYNDTLPDVIKKGDKRIDLLLFEFKKKKPNLREHQNSIWDISIKITLNNGEEIIAIMVRTYEHIEMYQTYKFIFIPVAGEQYVLPENITNILK